MDPPEVIIDKLTEEFAAGLRKSWEEWARAGLAQFFEQLQPPKCDAWPTGNCVGVIQTRYCPNGCGYVVHRCQRHGGTALGGAIGGHARKCRFGENTPSPSVTAPRGLAPEVKAKPVAQRRMLAERMYRCRSCYDLEWESELREHALKHGRIKPEATDAEIHALYHEPENPKGDDDDE